MNGGLLFRSVCAQMRKSAGGSRCAVRVAGSTWGNQDLEGEGRRLRATLSKTKVRQGGVNKLHVHPNVDGIAFRG